MSRDKYSEIIEILERMNITTRSSFYALNVLREGPKTSKTIAEESGGIPYSTACNALLRLIHRGIVEKKKGLYRIKDQKAMEVLDALDKVFSP